MYIYKHINIYIYLYIYIHTHIYIYIHTHTNPHSLPFSRTHSRMPQPSHSIKPPTHTPAPDTCHPNRPARIPSHRNKPYTKPCIDTPSTPASSARPPHTPAPPSVVPFPVALSCNTACSPRQQHASAHNPHTSTRGPYVNQYPNMHYLDTMRSSCPVHLTATYCAVHLE